MARGGRLLARVAVVGRRIGPAGWLVVASALGFVGVIAVVAIQSRQHQQIMEHLAERWLIRTATQTAADGYLQSVVAERDGADVGRRGSALVNRAKAELEAVIATGRIAYVGDEIELSGEAARRRIRGFLAEFDRFERALAAYEERGPDRTARAAAVATSFERIRRQASANDARVADGVAAMISRDDLFQSAIVYSTGGLLMAAAILAWLSNRSRARARQALLESEDLFREFFERSPIGATITAPGGRLLRANVAFCAFTGHTPEQIVRLTVDDVTHPDERRDVHRGIARLLAGAPESGSLQRRYLRRDGTDAWGESHSLLVRDATGKPLYILSHVVDVTGRRTAEKQQQEAHQRFVRLLEMIPLPLAHLTSGGTVEFVNRRFTEVFGYTRSDLPTISDWWALAYPDPEYRAWACTRWNSAVKAGGTIPSDVAYEMATRGGDTRLVEISAIVLGDAVLAALVDVTDRVRSGERMRQMIDELDLSRQVLLSVVEDQKIAETALNQLNVELEDRVLRRTAELSAANQELDSFAYAVSHDLRAPLRAMSGFSQAIVEDYGDSLPAEARGYLDQIRKASQNMSQLVEGLLVLSRSTRGELRHERVDLSAMAVRLCHELATSMPDTRPPRWEIQDGLVATGDGRLLEAVLRNLLANGWKYSGRAADPVVRVFAETVDGQLWFCVADNGVGFDMRHAGRLFKPFQRLHRQDEFPGIGIGLATVQRVIHRHGGTIQATGAVGEGATFRFSLPERPAIPTEAA